MFARDGTTAPLSTVASEAGVGIGTFYRRFPDRDSLLRELQRRAYADLERILDDVSGQPVTGRRAVQLFLERSVAIADRLVLPLRGTPAVGEDRGRAQARIASRVDALLERGRADGSIRAGVEALDIVVCGAVLTRPVMPGPGWDAIVARHIATYVAGLGAADA